MTNFGEAWKHGRKNEPVIITIYSVDDIKSTNVDFVLVVVTGPPRWPSGKASASRAEDPGFESRLRRKFFGVESYQ